jgi:hypothetical protein
VLCETQMDSLVQATVLCETQTFWYRLLCYVRHRWTVWYRLLYHLKGRQYCMGCAVSETQTVGQFIMQLTVLISDTRSAVPVFNILGVSLY